MASKKRIIFIVLLLILAAVAYGGYTYWQQVSQETQAITRVQKVGDLKSDQIINMLTSTDFKQKLQARKELNKLTPTEKKAVFLKMLSQKDAATRMMAVQGLKAYLSDAAVKKALEGMLKDKDTDVAAQAEEVLGGKK